MKKRMVCLCAVGALCLLMVALLPGVSAFAQDFGGMMGGGSSEESTVTATSVTGGGGGGGGSSGETRTVSHARSTTSTTTGYDALDLTVSSLPATELVVGGVSLDLTLRAEDGAALSYTVLLGHWQAASMAESIPAESVPEDDASQSEETNALRVTAQDDGAASWTFNGRTLRKLNNSGVRWLVLTSGAQTLAVPTDGVLGGYTYDQWRSAGVANKDIQYTLAAGVDPPQLQATAAGESCLASANAGDMLYYAGIISQGSGVNHIE